MRFIEALTTKRALYVIASVSAAILAVAAWREGVTWFAILMAALTPLLAWAALREPPAFTDAAER
ncbi:MAG: hypothetical protein Q4G43_14625 [Mobilicoccus sp.]|nr:hypothetical protein [Mobilicoccus sp.]